MSRRLVLLPLMLVWPSLVYAVPEHNDTVRLVPSKTCDPNGVVEFDFDKIETASVQYDSGPTGLTAFLFPAGVAAVSDVRGGSVGITGEEFGLLHALVFSGGSLYGLEAPYGVQAELHKQKSYDTGWDSFSLVAGAIIYDFFGRENAIYPDKELGRFAVKSASTGSFPTGRCGAGIHAAVGQGAAFRQIGSVKIAVFTVVNALGRIVDRGGAIQTHGRVSALHEIEDRHAIESHVTTNTTLTLVVTNVAGVDSSFARQVHASMARAIQPFHTSEDGDVLWVVTTNQIKTTEMKSWELGVMASELAWDAVLSAVEKGAP